ncbi:MAG: hypothetical protein FJ333_08710, partial [Sphingomonadales bacterium]|nr:hypothetical protein [Sphingomonadales bacterium]
MIAHPGLNLSSGAMEELAISGGELAGARAGGCRGLRALRGDGHEEGDVWMDGEHKAPRQAGLRWGMSTVVRKCCLERGLLAAAVCRAARRVS